MLALIPAAIAPGFAADVIVEQQIERAQVQREIVEQPAARVLPPARLENRPAGNAVKEAARADRRWRGLLSTQQQEKNRMDAAPGAPARQLQADRQQRADGLADRILSQDRQLRGK